MSAITLQLPDELARRLRGQEDRLPEVMALRPSATLSVRVEELLGKNRDGGLNAAEQREWERYEYLEHLVRMAKANASRRLSESPGDARRAAAFWWSTRLNS